MNSTKVDSYGRWNVLIVLTTGPANLTLVQSLDDNSEKIDLSVLVGEVWMCVGSDNMALPVSGLMNAEQEVEDSLNLTQAIKILSVICKM